MMDLMNPNMRTQIEFAQPSTNTAVSIFRDEQRFERKALVFTVSDFVSASTAAHVA